MNKHNKTMFDRMNAQATNRAESGIKEQELKLSYGTLKVILEYRVFKGQLTKDFVCDIAFKETIKVDV